MFEAVNERTGSRVSGFWSKEELEEYLDAVSASGDFWDVYSGKGCIDYYYEPRKPGEG